MIVEEVVVTKNKKLNKNNKTYTTKIQCNKKFKVKVDNGNIILASNSSKCKKDNYRLIIGDKVNVELSPIDKTKGRIVKRIG